jgi:hypothetical protein
MKIRIKRKLIVLIFSILLSTSSQSEIISKSISSLAGRYEYAIDSRTASFDMGVRFSSIESASIELTAQGIDGLAQVCNTIVTGPFSSNFTCTDYRESPKAFYQLDSENSTESGALIVDSTDMNTTSNILSETDQLLDGKGTLLLAHAQLDFEGFFQVLPIIFVSDVSIVIDGVVEPAINPPQSNSCFEVEGETVSSNLDIDVNNEIDALTDGLLIMRYLFGLTGNALIDGAIGNNASRITANEITTCLIEMDNILDIDGNSHLDALTDGILIIRFLFGSTLTHEIIADDATRTIPEIENYISNLLLDK